MIKEITNEDLSNEILNIFNSKVIDDKDPFNKFLGYFYDSKLIGFISYSIIYDRCEINFIGVLEEYRNNKIGSKLIKNLIGRLNSCKNITLEVNVNNYIAIKLYKKNGFEVASIRKKYYGNDDAYLMIKELGDIDE